jgi:hypothetical protein
MSRQEVDEVGPAIASLVRKQVAETHRRTRTGPRTSAKIRRTSIVTVGPAPIAVHVCTPRPQPIMTLRPMALMS